MTIQLIIKLFGTLSLKVPDYDHKTGIVMDAPDGATPEYVLSFLKISVSDVGLISHENQAIKWDTYLRDNMTISIFSPVYGG